MYIFVVYEAIIGDCTKGVFGFRFSGNNCWMTGANHANLDIIIDHKYTQTAEHYIISDTKKAVK